MARFRRRTFLAGLAATPAVTIIAGGTAAVVGTDDLVAHVKRISGGWDQAVYTRLLGQANAFKEGDEIVGVAAANEAERERARRLLARTPLRKIDAHPPFSDRLSAALAADLDPAVQGRIADWTLGALRGFLLAQPEAAIQAIMPGLSSDVIACVVRLLSNEELIRVGDTVYNPLPGTRIGGRGCLAARLQPNSPTDHPADIRWQVFDGWAYGVGDVVLGTNPVSSEPESVAAVSDTLREVLEVFRLADLMPHCVLAHIDVQAEVDAAAPGSTGVWFQSIAGSARSTRCSVTPTPGGDGGGSTSKPDRGPTSPTAMPGAQTWWSTRRGSMALLACFRGGWPRPAAARPGYTSTTWPASSGRRCFARGSSSSAAVSRIS